MVNDTQRHTGWWFQPLWRIWKSVGMIIPNIWKNNSHVPNHQPAYMHYPQIVSVPHSVRSQMSFPSAGPHGWLFELLRQFPETVQGSEVVSHQCHHWSHSHWQTKGMKVWSWIHGFQNSVIYPPYIHHIWYVSSQETLKLVRNPPYIIYPPWFFGSPSANDWCCWKSTGKPSKNMFSILSQWWFQIQPKPQVWITQGT